MRDQWVREPCAAGANGLWSWQDVKGFLVTFPHVADDQDKKMMQGPGKGLI